MTVMQLPERVCFCLNYEHGVKVCEASELSFSFSSNIKLDQVLLASLLVLRFAGLVCSVFYGPYIYLVICLSSLYFAGKYE